MTEQLTLVLDRRHKLIYDAPNRWAVQQIQPDGNYDTVSMWTGGPRSVVQWCVNHDVVPGPEVETALAAIPETGGFKDR